MARVIALLCVPARAPAQIILPRPASIVMSAPALDHTSVGNPDVIAFASPIVTSGNAWPNLPAQTTFTAPLAGIYYFSVNFVRDSASSNGTNDDVDVWLYRSGLPFGYAWAGESDFADNSARRMTGAYSVAMQLAKGETIEAWASSDGNVTRHIPACQLSAFLLQSPVVFSVPANEHTSQLSPDILSFGSPIVNRGNGWPNVPNATTFTAPLPGLYYFDLNFVRDSASNSGTHDDVFARLYKNGSPVGYAWAGESNTNDGSAKRMTGSYSVAIPLSAQDTVQVYADSDSGLTRHIVNAQLTGFLVGSQVVFSVSGGNHTSVGSPDVLTFDAPIVNRGNGWPIYVGGSTFTAPYRGVYYFSLSFVRDSYYAGGTSDDVLMWLYINGSPLGRAWAGESDLQDPSARRMTGAYSVAVQLNAGDNVEAWADSDGGAARHLIKYEMTGMLRFRN